ncbi:MAG: hypothetical protein FD127_3388 [Acidimicrobiaceae bacterium]|nr:MAG: hypothetical protein FD127_3388 [Acidimicrobiaceae bacterium]
MAGVRVAFLGAALIATYHSKRLKPIPGYRARSSSSDGRSAAVTPTVQLMSRSGGGGAGHSCFAGSGRRRPMTKAIITNVAVTAAG